jgi:hypothetical protein
VGQVTRLRPTTHTKARLARQNQLFTLAPVRVCSNLDGAGGLQLRTLDETFDIGDVTMAQTPSRPVTHPHRLLEVASRAPAIAEEEEYESADEAEEAEESVSGGNGLRRMRRKSNHQSVLAASTRSLRRASTVTVLGTRTTPGDCSPRSTLRYLSGLPR